MKWTTILTIGPMIACSVFATKGYAAEVPGVSPEMVADYVYAVVESHRAFYTAHVVELLEEQGIAKAIGDWQGEKRPFPCPFKSSTKQARGSHRNSVGFAIN